VQSGQTFLRSPRKKQVHCVTAKPMLGLNWEGEKEKGEKVWEKKVGSE
jgi:hypothetical protein